MPCAARTRKSIRENSMQAMEDFLTEQRAILTRIAEQAMQAPDGVGSMLDENSAAVKRSQLKQAIESLSGFAA